ncbi:MAG: hypothetical protein ACJA13_004071 [Paraglaciecola sp.]|jgi:uncharacterized protein involved in response to NO
MTKPHVTSEIPPLAAQLYSPVEKPKRPYPIVLFNLAFRVFFLAGAIWALAAMAIWAAWFSGYGPITFHLPPTLWHAHEMIFGFAALIAAGFLLTAVQTWTGLRSVHGRALIVLTLLWLTARLSLLLGQHQWGLWLFCVAQLGWWLGCIGFYARLVLTANSRNNYLFMYVLSAMALLNSLFVILVLKQNYAGAAHLVQSAIILFCALISVVGGRVIPFFTAKALSLPQSKNPTLDRFLWGLSVLATLWFAAEYFLAFTVSSGWIFILLAAGHLWRLGFWYSNRIWGMSLLWSLHLAYFAMALGLLLVGISQLTSYFPLKDSLHLISISAISALILSMMSRVSLGHTGRVLQVSHWLSLAFAMLLVAGVVRAVSGLFIHVAALWQISALLWVAAFGLFVWHYLPVLTRARVDGKQG